MSMTETGQKASAPLPTVVNGLSPASLESLDRIKGLAAQARRAAVARKIELARRARLENRDLGRSGGARPGKRRRPYFYNPSARD